MSVTPNCYSLTTGIATANCLGLNKPGGIDGTVYIGFRPDLDSVTFGTDGEITAMTLDSGKKLVKFAGKKLDHEIKWTLVAQKPVNMFQIVADLFLYPYTQAEVKSIEALLKQKRMFIIYVTTGGQVKAAGIDVNPWIAGELDDERGLEASAGEAAEGKTMEADTFNKVTLQGNFFNLPKTYKPASTLATVISELDALC